MNFSVIYLTNRKFPKAEWFFSSLRRELREEYEKIQIIIVDFWADDPGRKDAFRALAGRDIDHTTPKPTPWQGRHRIIDHDAFAAGNARNTGFILAKHLYVAFVDDVSVLVNGWLDAVRDGMNNYRIIAGVYRKVKELQVDEKGNLTHWIPFKPGNDHRFDENRKEPVPCPGNWFYGCSFAGPLEKFLEVNGYDECLDGLSFEDVCLGLRLCKAGNTIWLDQRMFTFESEEAHHNPDDVTFRRHNRPIPGYQDCAGEMLGYINSNPPLSRGTPDLRAIRKDVLAGASLPMHSGTFIWPDRKDLLGNKR